MNIQKNENLHDPKIVQRINEYVQGSIRNLKFYQK